MTQITVEVGIPDHHELQRICDEWFDAAPLETAYAAIQGDDEAGAETGDYSELPEREQERVKATALRYMWLAAARKRLEKP